MIEYLHDMSYNSCIPNTENRWNELGFKKTGGEPFLRLQAIDMSKDCCVEVLHTILLGIVKHCFELVFNNFLTPDQLETLMNICEAYKSKGLYRNLSSSLNVPV